MNRKWIGLTCSLALFSSVALGGCGSAENESGNKNDAANGGKPVSLRFSWWGSDTRHKATLAALDQYMQLNPNVKVEAEYGGYDGYEQKLKTQLAGQTAPDLIQIDQPWLYDLSQQSEVFADLSNFKDVIDLSGFDQKYLEDYSTLNKKLIGLPTGMSGMVMTYNKDFFDKYGIPENTAFDWDSLLEIGRKVKEQGKGTDVLLNVDPGLVSEMFKYFVRQKTGKQFIQDDYTLGFDKAAAVEALDHLKKFLDAGVIQPFEESSAFDRKADQNPKWFKGEIGLVLGVTSLIPALKKDVKFTTGVTSSIIAKDAKNSAVIARPSQIFAVSKNSKNAKEAAKLLNWLLNDKEAALILGDVRGTPASKTAMKALEEAGKLDPEIVKATEIALKTSGGPENGISNNAELGKIRGDIIQKLAFRKLTPEQAADEMINSLNAKLKELKG